MFPFRRHDERVERVITVGSGFAHVGDHPWSYRSTVIAFWYLLGPLATALTGYLPGRRLLLGADLPAGIYWQWRRWCMSRNFFRGDIGNSLQDPDFSAPRFDLRNLTMADDIVVPPAAAWRYADAFGPDSVERWILRPEEFGLSSLRHIQVMSKSGAPAWPVILGLKRRPPPEERAQ